MNNSKVQEYLVLPDLPLMKRRIVLWVLLIALSGMFFSIAEPKDTLISMINYFNIVVAVVMGGYTFLKVHSKKEIYFVFSGSCFLIESILMMIFLYKRCFLTGMIKSSVVLMGFILLYISVGIIATRIGGMILKNEDSQNKIVNRVYSIMKSKDSSIPFVAVAAGLSISKIDNSLSAPYITMTMYYVIALGLLFGTNGFQKYFCTKPIKWIEILKLSIICNKSVGKSNCKNFTTEKSSPRCDNCMKNRGVAFL